MPAALKLSLTPTPEDHTHAPISSGLRRQLTLILTDEFSYEDVAIVLCSVLCAAAARRSVFCAAKQNKNQPPYQESWVAGFSWVRVSFSFLLITDSRARAELARRAGAGAGVTWGLLLSLVVEC